MFDPEETVRLAGLRVLTAAFVTAALVCIFAAGWFLRGAYGVGP